MTPMAHWLVRLHGKDPEGWTDADWTTRADKLAELWWVDGWIGPPDWLDLEHARWLDWGARLVPVTKDELLKLFSTPPGHDDGKETRMFEALDPAGSYAVIWTEEGGRTLGPGQPAPPG